MRFPLSLVLFFAASFCPPLGWVQEQQTSTPPSTPSYSTNQGRRASEGPSSPKDAATDSLSPVLPEGTAVKLKLLQPLNSKIVVVDDPLNFSVAEDVVVDSKALVKAGTVAIGRVRQARRAGMAGRGAQLTIEMQYLKVGRIRVPLRGSQDRTGEDKKGEVAVWVALFGLSGLVKHGSEVDVKEGTVFIAYVDQATALPVSPEEPRPRPQP